MLKGLRFLSNSFFKKLIFPPFQVIVNSFEVRDKLESSDINKLLHLYSNKLRPRQSNANMFSLKCVNLRPDPDMPQAEESVINVNLQPLR